MSYIVKSLLRFDGTRYEPGDEAPPMSQTERDRLLDLGVIGRAEGGEQRAEISGKAAPRPTHALLDARANEIGIEFAEGLTVADKLAALAEVREAESGEQRAESSDAEAETEGGGEGLPAGVSSALV